MPKPGFKSITVSEQVYEKFHDVYNKNKEELTMKGVNSFSGYVTYMLEEMMQKDKTFARYAPKLEKISVDDDRVIQFQCFNPAIACWPAWVQRRECGPSHPLALPDNEHISGLARAGRSNWYNR